MQMYSWNHLSIMKGNMVMKDRLFSYDTGHTLVHRLSGLAKLIIFLVLTFTVMLSYDLRLIVAVSIFALLALKIAKVKWSQIRFMVIYVAIFIVINVFFTFLFSPLEGVEIYGTQHNLFTIYGNYIVTQEELFYLLTKTLKYIAVLPLGLLFFLTTHPSEFASSLNRIGIPYKVAYAFALTMRYFPDVSREYHQIALASQARGLDLSKKEKFMTRIKNAMGIVIPLIFSTLERIESVANAMDLRGFGKLKKRSWYNERVLSNEDRLWIAVSIGFLIVSLWLTFVVNGSRFFNPFI